MNHAPILVLAVVANGLAAQWSQAAAAVTPGARTGHGLAADGLGNVLMFGGVAASPLQPHGDTWRWDGSTWTLLSPPIAPGGRSAIELVHDVARARHVVFGGWTSPVSPGAGSAQTWEFDGATWTLRAPPVSPGARWSHGACYDAARSRVVLYGGAADFSISLQDTWEYDGTTWQQNAAAVGPGPLVAPAMCYHAGVNRTVLFGGRAQPTAANDITWLYDGVAWTAASVAGARPSPRWGAKMVFDPWRGVCVLFGGVDPATLAPLADTWEFDGTAAWTPTVAAATGSAGFGLAFDAVRRQVVRHGGGGVAAPNGETWVFGSQVATLGAGCAGSNGTPLLAAAGVPRLAEPWALTLTGAAVVAPFAVVAFGSATAGPVALDPIGMTGCTGWIQPDLLLGVPASGGVASWSATLPGHAALVGAHLYAQALSFDPGINAAWLTASNALDGLLGR
jgi:hypothetical protein